MIKRRKLLRRKKKKSPEKLKKLKLKKKRREEESDYPKPELVHRPRVWAKRPPGLVILHLSFSIKEAKEVLRWLKKGRERKAIREAVREVRKALRAELARKANARKSLKKRKHSGSSTRAQRKSDE